jgi:hypothetical protein
MKADSGRLVRLAALSALAVACNVDTAPNGPGAPAFDRSSVSALSLVQDSVLPQETDRAIDKALARHYVWLDRAARSNHKLLVLMPPAGAGRPALMQLLQHEAAAVGYHVIGLMYQNDVGLAAVCGDDACFENIRLEILDGVDRSPLVDVSAANGIENRLTKLLQFLTERYPDDGWDRFLLQGRPKWSQIAVGGSSQGGGQAAIIAKVHLVARVVLFSASTDSIHTEAPQWLATHITPSERYWGLAHDRDDFFLPILASWDSLGIAVFGDTAYVDAREPPYGYTHMLVTNVLPRTGSYANNAAHRATANDPFTPVAPDGTPLLRDAWRYMLTAPQPDTDVVEPSALR